METLPHLSSQSHRFCSLALHQKQAPGTSPSVFKLETRCFPTSVLRSLGKTIWGESSTFCLFHPSHNSKFSLATARTTRWQCLLSSCSCIGRVTVVPLCALENWNWRRKFNSYDPPFGKWDICYAKKELPESVIAKAWQRGLFDLFKKGQNQELAADICVHSTKELRFRQNFARQLIAACFCFFIPGFIMELHCSVAAAAEDTFSYVKDSKGSVELPPIPTNFPPLKDPIPPTFEKMVLPNGLRVFLLEDHELGLVGGQIIVKAGSKDEPEEKVGLATISSNVQRSGGTTQHDAELLDTKLEEMAAQIEASSGRSEMSVGFRCLTEDLPKVMSLFSEVVQQPLMPKNKLDFTRTQLLGSIKRRGDDPGDITAREFSKLLYGDGSIYSRYFTEETLKSITQEDLLSFHKSTFRPAASILGIWGDFNKLVVKDIIRDTFGGWNVHENELKGEIQSGDIRNKTSEAEAGLSFVKPRIYVIDKPGLTQGFVRLGELGTTLSDPDVFALDVLNDILNGFGGLLFDQIRSKEGLAYSVYGRWTPAVEHRGSFLAGGQTQIDTIPQFITSIQNVLESVTQSPPAEGILARAKEGIINSFVFNFVDSGAQLSRLMTYELFGIDQNFIFNYKKKVEALTGNEIVEAAKHHLHPHSQPILVVTDVSKVKSVLQRLKMDVVYLTPEYLTDK